MLITNINIESHSDNAILKMIGEFIRHHRQNQNKTQAKLAKEAGINRSTLSEIENGNRSNTMTLIQILRSLGKLDVLEEFTNTKKISPMALAEEQAVYRKRVRPKKESKSPIPKSDW